MSENLKISIVVPIYNVEEYLDECVTSLVNQTYNNLEILLVNDGSTDGTAKKIDEWAKKDERIKVFHKENEGTHSARNLGIANATGEYVMFIDPDDWIDLNTVESLVFEIETNGADVVRYNYVREYKGNSLPKQNTLLQEKVYENQEVLRVLRKTVGLVGEELKNIENLNFLASACFSVYRISVIKENKLAFQSIRIFGSFVDGLFNLSFLKVAKKFQYLNQYFYHYRKTNPKSATSNYREGFVDKQILLFNEIKQTISDYQTNDFIEAFNTRIAVGGMEACFNEFKNGCSFSKKYRAIKKILKSPIYFESYKGLSIKHFSLKWKIFYFCMKHRLVLSVCILLKVMKKLKGRV